MIELIHGDCLEELKKPILLDLFCKAGGCTKGYQRAGFHVVGVDIEPQPRYCGEEFIQADAIEFLKTADLSRFDVIHASPECKGYSICANLPNVTKNYPKLIEPTRELLLKIGKPYVIENVVGAPLCSPIMLCGLMFGLKVFRHRLFECSEFLYQPSHGNHKGKRIGIDGYCCVAGNGDSNYSRHSDKHKDGKKAFVDAYHCRKSTWEKAMGIDWMTKHELTQAIPPAYTEFIGRQLINVLAHR